MKPFNPFARAAFGPELRNRYLPRLEVALRIALNRWNVQNKYAALMVSFRGIGGRLQEPNS